MNPIFCDYCRRELSKGHAEWCLPLLPFIRTTTELAASPTAPTFAFSVDADGMYPRQPEFFPPIQ